jgi:hypothetical protein
MSFVWFSKAFNQKSAVKLENEYAVSHSLEMHYKSVQAGDNGDSYDNI